MSTEKKFRERRGKSRIKYHLIHINPDLEQVVIHDLQVLSKFDTINNMVAETFAKIKDLYGVYSSFAVWNEENINDLGFIDNNIDCLHGRVIFVAYNASAQIKKFQNFHFIHQGGRDLWLAKSIGKQSNLKGAYMTDFFKGDFAKREGGVLIDEKIIENNKKILEQEIILLGEKKTVLVAIGRKSEKILYDCGFSCEYIPHFSGRITWTKFEKEVTQLNRRLQK